MHQYSIGRFRGGLCVYWWDSGKRKRFQLKARTRKEAEAEAIDVIRKETLKPEGVNITYIWEAYVESLGDRPTAKTMKYTGRAVLDHFGSLRPDQVTSSHCTDYTAQRRSMNIKDGSIWTELGHLRSALNWACNSARLTDNIPQIPRPEKPDPPERFLSTEEIARLFAGAREPHILLAINLMLATAGRIGAILSLKWDRVDFTRGVVNLRLEDGKRKKGRAIVPMNDGLRAALSRAKQAALSDYVVEYAGRPVKSIRRGFYGAVTRANLQNVTQHTIRHTAAVHLVSSGVPIEKVAQYLGHSNIAITYSTYARYAPEHLQDAADILDFTSLKKRQRL